METFVIFIGISITAILLWAIKLIKFELADKEKAIDDLIKENVELIVENRKLKKQNNEHLSN